MFTDEKIEKEFLIVGDYFPNGGETYSIDELSVKIENDLGYDKGDAIALIRNCVEKGFITDVGNGVYTR